MNKDNESQELATPSIEKARKPSQHVDAAHAPGPWRVIEGDKSTFVYNQAGELIATMGLRADSNANARLIAAAPALWDALTKIYYDNEAACGCECEADTCCNRVGEPCPKCDSRAALALANGQRTRTASGD